MNEQNLNHSRKEQRLKKRKKKFKIILGFEIGFIVILAIAAGLFFFIKSKTYGNLNTDAVDFKREEIVINDDISEKVLKHSERYTTIMLYGVDARNNKDLVKDANADTDIIVCIDNETGDIKLVSVLRDTFLSMTSGKYRKLTDIYAGWGVKESLQTINMNFDLAITQYVTVNWKSVAVACDLLGGLDIDLTTAEIKNMNSLLPSVKEATGLYSDPITGTDGTYHLNGVMCVCYARVRYVGQHDIKRAERQRILIGKALDAAKQCSLSQLNDICEQVFPGIATNLTFGECIELLTQIGDLNISEQGLFPYDYVDQDNLTTAYVYCTTLEENVVQLHHFLYDDYEFIASGTVKNISEHITEYRHEHP